MNEQGIFWFYLIFTLAILGMLVMLAIYYYQENMQKNVKVNNSKMTNDDKDLILKDVCGRMCYGVILMKKDMSNCIQIDCSANLKAFIYNDWLPVLRRMSSMTDKEKEMLVNASNYEFKYTNDGMDCRYIHTLGDEYAGKITIWNIEPSAIDWLNEHHFDYRGLIDKNLAIEATNDILKITYNVNT